MITGTVNAHREAIVRLTIVSMSLTQCLFRMWVAEGFSPVVGMSSSRHLAVGFLARDFTPLAMGIMVVTAEPPQAIWESKVF